MTNFLALSPYRVGLQATACYLVATPFLSAFSFSKPLSVGFPSG